MNKNGDKPYQNLWHTVKEVLKRKFRDLNTYVKRKENSQTNNISFHLKKLEKEEETKPKTSRKKEIIMIGAEIHRRKKHRKII